VRQSLHVKEVNRSRAESRRLLAQETTPEQIGFPAAAQIGLHTSVRGKHSTPETVGLITSYARAQLPIEQFLKAKRRYWTIENGVHQRLDGAANEDRSRVRTGTAPLVLAMFRRLPFGFYTHWAALQKPRQRSLQCFYDAMDRRNHRWPVLLVGRSHSRRWVTCPPP
jgi:hypothetical protein